MPTGEARERIKASDNGDGWKRLRRGRGTEQMGSQNGLGS